MPIGAIRITCLTAVAVPTSIAHGKGGSIRSGRGESRQAGQRVPCGEAAIVIMGLPVRPICPPTSRVVMLSASVL